MSNRFISLGCHRILALVFALWLLPLLLLGACGQRPSADTPTPTADSASEVSLPTRIESNSAYPAVVATPTPSSAIPAAVPTRITPSPAPDSIEPSGTSQFFLPSIQQSGPTKTPSPSPIPSPTSTPTLDFSALRSELQASGQDLAFVKIGFHVTSLNASEEEALYEHLRRLDQAGVPFFLKSASNAEPLYYAQQLMMASGVPHTLVYRSTAWDVPEYRRSPAQAAELHWQQHRDAFPPELDRNLVWVETLNEVDKNRSEWLARFALKTAELAMADGFRWAAFGWASGEPEPEDWQSPAMLEFLRLAGSYPDRLAIALHEYSFVADDIGHSYPYKVGRFLELFRLVDGRGIPRPTVLITEWGWSYEEVPPVDQALRHIHWASSLYAPFPEVKGAALWNLGFLGDKNDLSGMVSPYLPPLTEYSLGTYFAIPLSPDQAGTAPELYQP